MYVVTLSEKLPLNVLILPAPSIVKTTFSVFSGLVPMMRLGGVYSTVSNGRMMPSRLDSVRPCQINHARQREHAHVNVIGRFKRPVLHRL